MALKATVHRAELQVSDLDRHYYASHSLTLAQHPSETDARLMVRLCAFALFAQERLEFGRGLSAEDEPDLWLRSYTGEIEHWIELGQPDEARLRRACGRARRVSLVGYSGRAFQIWWEKNAAALARCSNLEVIELPAGAADDLAALLERGMQLQCIVQEGELQLMSDSATVSLTPVLLQAATRG
ncbi:MAG: YaeQ family protein [Aquimonas sp.]|nr:YaeQ family protein [Aquimonas sp.]